MTTQSALDPAACDATWSVRTRKDGGLGIEIGFEAPALGISDSWTAGADYEFAMLRDASTSIRASLESDIGTWKIGLGQPPSVATVHLDRMLRRCKVLLRLYSGGQPDRIRRHLRTLIDSYAGRLPLLDVDAPYAPPLDMAPVFASETNLFDNPGDLRPLHERAQDCFLGLNVALRLFSSSDAPSSMPTDRQVRAEPAANGRVIIRVDPIVNAELAQVARHLRQLPTTGPYRLERELPRAETLNAELVSTLLERPQAGSVHIAAHCINLPPPRALDSHLLFRSARRLLPRSELAVKLEDLISLRDDHRTQNQTPTGPLCVLIACAASNSATASPSSFPSTLLAAGYRCVIAPVVSVYTEPAFLFIERVYAYLARGRTIAAALVDARLELLRQHGCPIGLVFMSHGDSWLALPIEAMLNVAPDGGPLERAPDDGSGASRRHIPSPRPPETVPADMSPAGHSRS